MDTTSPNIDPQDFDQIEQYLLDQMSASERRLLESRMEQDAAFKAEVVLQKELMDAIQEKALKKSLNKFHEVFEDDSLERKDNIPQKSFSSSFYWMAASIVLFMAVGGFWLTNRPSETDRLFVKYFEADSGLPTTMGNTDNYPFLRAMVDYKQADYGSAITKWSSQLPEKPENDTLNYYLGVANLAHGDVDTAIRFLEDKVVQESTVFGTKANYYLGLGHLKNGDVEAAINWLKKSKNKKSEELLLQLKP